MPAYYGAVDLQKNELRQAQIQNLASAPSNPVTGQLYFNSSDATLYFCSVGGGSPVWIAAKAGAGTAAATTVTTQAIGDAPTVGVLTAFAREDHKHGMPAFGNVTAETSYGISSSNGSAATLARSDHTHGTPSLTNAVASTQAVGDTATAGSGTLPAREDHKHAMPAFGGTVTAETTFGNSSNVGVATTLARSDHTHGTPVHDAAAHSFLSLNNLSAATGNYSMGASYRITGMADPVAGGDAATKNYVDSIAQGLDAHQSVRMATTAVVGGTHLASGGTSARGQWTSMPNTAIDGVTPAQGNRILVKNELGPQTNGIYVITTLGTGSNGVWDRATDADADGDLTAGAYVFVEEGTTNGDTGWLLTTNNPIIVGGASGTAQTWTQFSGAGQITDGAGLVKTGNTMDIRAGYGINLSSPTGDAVNVDSSVIATVASLGSYVANTRQVIAGNGLTGGGALSADATINVANADGTLTIAADDVKVNTSTIATVASLSGYVPTSRTVSTGAGLTGGGALSGNLTIALDTTGQASGSGTVSGVRKYAQTLTGTASPETVTHSLGTRDVQVTVYNGATPYTAVEVDWDATTTSAVTIRYNPALGAGYRVVVVG